LPFAPAAIAVEDWTFRFDWSAAGVFGFDPFACFFWDLPAADAEFEEARTTGASSSLATNFLGTAAAVTSDALINRKAVHLAIQRIEVKICSKTAPGAPREASLAICLFLAKAWENGTDSRKGHSERRSPIMYSGNRV
jgi:hypothetical protein